jgi:hypothetical protein
MGLCLNSIFLANEIKQSDILAPWKFIYSNYLFIYSLLFIIIIIITLLSFMFIVFMSYFF